MDNVLEAINIALTGATSLLRKISTGNTRLVPALNKIMQTLIVYDNVVHNNGPCQGPRLVVSRGGTIVSNTGLSQ